MQTGLLKKAETVKSLAQRNGVTTDFVNKLIHQGMKVESEHSDDTQIQRTIAIQHLSENLRYYKALLKMESGLLAYDTSIGKMQSQSFVRGGDLSSTPAGGAIESVRNGKTVVSNDGTGGGIFKGQRHSGPNDGIDVAVSGAGKVKVETDEALLVPDAVNKQGIVELDGQNMTTKQAVSKINQEYGGVPIKRQGGEVNTTNPAERIQEETGQDIKVREKSVVVTRDAVLDSKKREFNGEMLTNRQILSRVNVAGGGAAFEEGGQMPAEIYCGGGNFNYGGKIMGSAELIDNMNSSCGCQHSKMQSGGEMRDVEKVENAKNKVIAELAALKLTGTNKMLFKNKPVFMLQFIQDQATGTVGGDVMDNRYEDTVNMIGDEQLVKKCISVIPAEQKQKILQYLGACSYSIPAGLTSALKTDTYERGGSMTAGTKKQTPAEKELERERELLKEFPTHASQEYDQDRVIKSSDIGRELKLFMPLHQQKAIIGNPEIWLQIEQLDWIVKNMPKTYQTNEVDPDDKIVWLHYFFGGSDWYIVEKDMVGSQKQVGEQLQAFGFAILNQDYQNAQWGYISIQELRTMVIQRYLGIELDFYFTPRPFREVRQAWYPDETTVTTEVLYEKPKEGTFSYGERFDVPENYSIELLRHLSEMGFNIVEKKGQSVDLFKDGHRFYVNDNGGEFNMVDIKTQEHIADVPYSISKNGNDKFARKPKTLAEEIAIRFNEYYEDIPGEVDDDTIIIDPVDFIIKTAHEIVQKKASELSYDNFHNWYAKTFLLQSGNRESEKEILKSYGLEINSDILQLYTAARKEQLSGEYEDKYGRGIYLFSQKLYEGAPWDPKFTIDADSWDEANTLKLHYAKYHNIPAVDFKIEKVPSGKYSDAWMHNEYVDGYRTKKVALSKPAETLHALLENTGDAEEKAVVMNEAPSVKEAISGDSQIIAATDQEDNNSNLMARFGNAKQSVKNNVIRDLLKRKGADADKYSADEIAFLKLYEGAGGLAKQGESGARLFDQFFTPVGVCGKMWGMALKYGFEFKNANILEPAVGSGRFLQFIPTNQGATVTAYDVDETSYLLCKVLFPDFDIKHGSFEQMFFKGRRHIGLAGVARQFDLVIGNPPYRDYISEWKPLGEGEASGATTFEQYFIGRGVDVLKPGGLLIMIIPNTFMSNDGKYNDFKVNLAKKVDMLEAWRLPNGTFNNTETGTDVICVRKKDK